MRRAVFNTAAAIYKTFSYLAVLLVLLRKKRYNS